MRLTGTCVLVLSVFVFAGAAYAGNGNGNGNGNGGGASTAAPGNSANAPGQQKKDEAPVADTTTTVAVPSAPASEGVKPSNETAHDTHAEAQSDQTKQYGNGQTAGQIALKNGAKATTVLHGPGNSQPHKASPCTGGHEVDVHALKGRRAGSCGGDPPHPTPTPVSPPDPRQPPTVTTTSEQKPLHTPASLDPAPQPPVGGRAGDVATESRADGHSQGVLAATQRIGRTASLPFTGQPLWPVVLLGLILIATGLALREIRTAEACVESEHDHTDRAAHAARGTRSPVSGRSGR